MTLKQAKKLYLTVFKSINGWGRETDYSETDWGYIHNEMERIVAARTDREAAKVVVWWGCWKKVTATGYARKVRETFTKMALEKQRKKIRKPSQ